MTGGLNLYLRSDTPLHRLDARAKLIAITGFVAAAMLAPVRPLWPSAVLLGLLALTMLAARVSPVVMAKRLLGLALVIGLPFVLTRFGDPQTQHAGELFAVKSLLVAGAFVVLTATTQPAPILDAIARLPLLAGLGALAAFIVRGVDVLAGEVVRANRAWVLRAPSARPRVKMKGLTSASIALLGRAAARSERVGAAMVLRGFDARMPPPPAAPLPTRDLVLGIAFAAASLLIAGVGRCL